jgi:hypothetical protein
VLNNIESEKLRTLPLRCMPLMPKLPTDQLDKFKDAARDAECDMHQKAFDEALKKVSATGKIPDSGNREPDDDSSNDGRTPKRD